MASPSIDQRAGAPAGWQGETVGLHNLMRHDVRTLRKAGHGSRQRSEPQSLAEPRQPRPSCVDNDLCADVERVTRETVGHPHAADPVSAAQDTVDGRVVRDDGTAPHRALEKRQRHPLRAMQVRLVEQVRTRHVVARADLWHEALEPRTTVEPAARHLLRRVGDATVFAAGKPRIRPHSALQKPPPRRSPVWVGMRNGTQCVRCGAIR